MALGKKKEIELPTVVRVRPADSPDYYGAPTIAEPDLAQLEHEMGRNKLREIALLVASLTYGEMIDLDAGIRKADTEGKIPKDANLAHILHVWTGNQLSEGSDETRG